MTGVGWLIGLVANADAIGFAYFFDVLSSLQVKEQFQFFYYRKETLLLQLFRFYIAVFLKHDNEVNSRTVLFLTICSQGLYLVIVTCIVNTEVGQFMQTSEIIW